MLSQQSKVSHPLLIIILMILILLAIAYKPSTLYPNIKILTKDNVEISLLLKASNTQTACQQDISEAISLVKTACTSCQILSQGCTKQLNTQQKALLSSATLPYPSSQSDIASASYISSDSQASLNACNEYEQSNAIHLMHIKCYPPQHLRPVTQGVQLNSNNNLLKLLLILTITTMVSWFACKMILYFEKFHAHLSHDHNNSGPQKFHAQPTPRIGGIALMLSLITVAAIIPKLLPNNFSTVSEINFLILASAPVFLGGVLEDLTKRVGVAQRLLLSMISSAIAICLLGALIDHSAIPMLDSVLMLSLTPFAIICTIFAVSGIVNSINIIDGYNGLSAGFSALVFTALAIVAFMVNDMLVLIVSVSMIGALFGFLAWNWPYGKIFLGDGGAYLLGFILAEVSILLLYRNPIVSPWFPFLLLSYPIFETLFSIYRRKWIRKAAPGQPDAHHLHQLIFKRLVRGHIHGNRPGRLTLNNSRVAPYFWWTASFSSIFAVGFWQDTEILLLATVIGCVIYVLLYRQLTSFKGMVKLSRKKV